MTSYTTYHISNPWTSARSSQTNVISHPWRPGFISLIHTPPTRAVFRGKVSIYSENMLHQRKQNSVLRSLLWMNIKLHKPHVLTISAKPVFHDTGSKLKLYPLHSLWVTLLILLNDQSRQEAATLVIRWEQTAYKLCAWSCSAVGVCKVRLLGVSLLVLDKHSIMPISIVVLIVYSTFTGIFFYVACKSKVTLKNISQCL